MDDTGDPETSPYTEVRHRLQRGVSFQGVLLRHEMEDGM